jgi:hypothetical protein
VGATRLYRVRSSGETFRDIAQHTLNNSDRWAEIYKLNPGVNPATLIEGRTVLYLPGDAQVEPADAP